MGTHNAELLNGFRKFCEVKQMFDLSLRIRVMLKISEAEKYLRVILLEHGETVRSESVSVALHPLQ